MFHLRGGGDNEFQICTYMKIDNLRPTFSVSYKKITHFKTAQTAE